MNIYWFIIVFTAWYIFSLVVSEKLGKKRRIGEEWSFFISMMLSPLVGLVVVLVSKPRQNGTAPISDISSTRGS